MVESEHPEVIWGRCQLIAVYVLGPDDAADYGSIYYYGDDLDE